MTATALKLKNTASVAVANWRDNERQAHLNRMLSDAQYRHGYEQAERCRFDSNRDGSYMILGRDEIGELYLPATPVEAEGIKAYFRWNGYPAQFWSH